MRDELVAERACLAEPDDDRFRALEAAAAAHLHVTPANVHGLSFGRSTRPGARVLIVEDEPLVAKALARHVELAGHTVTFATTSAETIERLASQRFELVLCDLGLPGALEGPDLVRAIAGPGGPPIVVVTGRSDMNSAIESLQTGAAEYLEKPLTAEIAQRTLRNVMRVTVRDADGARRDVVPFALGDLGDRDNYVQLCLDDAADVVSVNVEAGVARDQRGDLNAATMVDVTLPL